MHCVEIELCGLCDAYRGGSPDARYMGRAEGARVVLERCLRQRAAAEKGKLDITTYGYAWSATRARELIWLGISALKAGSQWAEAARRQWTGLIGRFQRPGKLLRSIMAEDNKFMQCIRLLGAQSCVSTSRRWKDGRHGWRAGLLNAQRAGSRPSCVYGRQ